MQGVQGVQGVRGSSLSSKLSEYRFLGGLNILWLLHGHFRGLHGLPWKGPWNSMESPWTYFIGTGALRAGSESVSGFAVAIPIPIPTTITSPKVSSL